VTEGQDLAARVRAALVGAGAGNLIAGASPRGLLVRVGKDRQAEALGELPPKSAARKPRRVSGKRAPIASRRAR